jgi:hypothetical protein
MSGIWSKIGLRTIQGVANTTDRGSSSTNDITAAAKHCKCHLAKKDIGLGACMKKCQSAAGYHMKSWGCCYGGAFYTCGECTKASNCSTGPFKCSGMEHVSSC